MFSLAYGLIKKWTKYKEYKVLILGTGGSGKTSLLEGIKEIYTGKPRLPKLFPTTGLNLQRLPMGDSRFLFWDLGGQKEHREIVWPNYIRDTQALIFVIDASGSPQSLEEARATLHEVLRGGLLAGPIPLLLVCNKMDLPNAKTAHVVEEYLEIFRFEELVLAYRVQEMQTKSDQGIKEGIDWIVGYMKNFVVPLEV